MTDQTETTERPAPRARNVMAPADKGHALEQAQPKASSGLVQVEQQRAIAEVQARMMIARANPRDTRRACDMILQDCMRPSLAEAAVYQYSKGGQNIEGASIRLAEAIAQRWGNLSCGFKEISRGEGFSDVLVEAWDLETGFHDFRQFQVRHWRDKKGGKGYLLEDEREIYELIANQAQRRKRSVILAMIPRDVLDMALEQCDVTLKAKADTSAEGIKKLLDAFAEFGVVREQIEKRIQRKIESISAAQIVSLKKVYASLRDEMSSIEDWFDPVEDKSGAGGPAGGMAGLNEAMKNRSKGGSTDGSEKPAASTVEKSGDAPAAQKPAQEAAAATTSAPAQDSTAAAPASSAKPAADQPAQPTTRKRPPSGGFGGVRES